MGRGEGQTSFISALDSSNQVDPAALVGKVAIIALGAPGAGKGTQSALLASRLGFPHVSTGDILRGASDRVVNDEGLTMGELLAAGQFADDETMFAIILDRLHESDISEGIILDGFPRNLFQAEAFEGIALEAGFAPPIAIELSVTDDEAVKRALGRGTGRLDDTPEVMQERLRIYHERTAPLINFYRERHRLESVDGERPVQNVSNDMLRSYLRLVERLAEER
jgi:adenylate kinase